MSFLLNQCFFCAEENNLIQMDTNSLIIEGVYVDFAQLILELMQITLDDDLSGNLICTSCKDQLTQFYLMKKRAAKHRTISDVRKMRIVDTVVNFLDTTPADFIVRQYPKFLVVHPDNASTTFQEQLQRCNYYLDMQEYEEPMSEEVIDIDEFNLKEEVTEHEQFNATENAGDYEINHYEIIPHEELAQNEIEVEVRSEEEDLIEEELTENATEVETPTIPKSKKYQKSTLDPKQREWMRKKVKHCIVRIQTSFGVKSQWCCDKCKLKCFNTETSFRLHLRTHLEDSKVEISEGESEDLDENNIVKVQFNSEEQSILEQKMWIKEQLGTQKEVLLTKEGQQTSWKCSLCEFVTHKRLRFRGHLIKEHTTIVARGPSKHSCIECRLRFDGESHLIVHRNCHRIFEVIATYAVYPECSVCKMIFISNEDLQLHLERHKNDPESLLMPITALGVVYRNGEAFVDENYSKTEVLDENAKSCGHCLMKFATDEECKQHLMLFHATSFVCPFDQRVFDGIPTLSFSNHLRHFHSEIFPDLEIACSLCKMQFDTVYDKLAHMKVCSAKKFHCDHCDKNFFRKAELVHHLKVVTGQRVFACHLCGKQCKDRGDLKIHLRSHTNDRPYPCPHCERSYKTSSARASHVESHMDQIHVCNICNVKFRRRILYQRHIKLLHDEGYRQKCFAENTCQYCGKSYLRKSHFKNHMKIHYVNLS